MESNAMAAKRGGEIDILIVDDQPQKLLTYEAILQPLGENVLRANSGAEALDLLLKRDIAVILLDVVMPEMDGFELARIVRSHRRFEKTPIIFVSAISTGEMERLTAYELGGVDYVNVPIVPEILRTKVSVFVDLHRKTRALQELNRELEGRVAERTAELKERAERLEHEVEERTRLVGQLRERAEKLAEADRLKNEFLAMLAHELRNPLATVLNAMEILRIPSSDEAVRERAREMAKRQVKHLTRILDDLLDVSRITRGKIVLHNQPVLVREATEHVVEATRDLLEGRRHEILVDLPREPLWVDADPTRLEQVLTNLLSNAAKYTGLGGHIELSVRREQEWVVIRVRDDGVGMDATMLPRVFDLFTQASRSLDRSEGGLGIGLTLVKRLVEMHGGKVAATSPGPGQGSEFTVHLPLLAVSIADIPERRSETQIHGGPSRRVLVVEDNLDVASTLALLLRTLGHDVQTVHNGEHALRVASDSQPDLVLMDIGLPGLDGYEVARQLRADGKFRAVRLVALTGYVRDADRERSRAAGFDDHLAKPVTLETLERLLLHVAAASAPDSSRRV